LRACLCSPFLVLIVLRAAFVRSEALRLCKAGQFDAAVRELERRPDAFGGSAILVECKRRQDFAGAESVWLTLQRGGVQLDAFHISALLGCATATGNELRALGHVAAALGSGSQLHPTSLACLLLALKACMARDPPSRRSAETRAVIADSAECLVRSLQLDGAASDRAVRSEAAGGQPPAVLNAGGFTTVARALVQGGRGEQLSALLEVMQSAGIAFRSDPMFFTAVLGELSHAPSAGRAGAELVAAAVAGVTGGTLELSVEVSCPALLVLVCMPWLTALCVCACGAAVGCAAGRAGQVGRDAVGAASAGARGGCRAAADLA
jgi:hypothetical protein